ncbi:MAG: CvpA family protein, partial [Clostridia bacterium]|nr:CvpA family protein [Clostridia bacterium]
MSIVIDLAIVAMVVLCAVRHYKLGLFCSLLTFGKFVAAIILAGILRTPLALLGLNIIVGGGQYTPVQSAFAGIIAFVVIFAAVIAVSGFLIKKLSKIEIPIITRFDKLLGLALGLVIGVFVASLAATAAYTV